MTEPTGPPRLQPRDGEWDEVRARVGRARRRQNAVAAAGVAAVLVLGGGTVLALSSSGGTSTSTILATQPPRVAVPSASPSASPLGSSAAPASSPATPSQAPASASASSASTACTAGGPIPSGAATGTIPDVDGDGRADTGFIYRAGDGTPVIGVHTAAGGTFVADFDSASGAEGRTVTFAQVPGGPVVALTDDNRESQLFVVDGCLLKPVMNPQGQQYEFDLRDFGGNGDGVTCGTVAGQGSETLVGFQYSRDASGTETGGEKRTAVVISGLGGFGTVTATNGKSETLSTMPDASGISCGAVTEAKDAISLPSE